MPTSSETATGPSKPVTWQQYLHLVGVYLCPQWPKALLMTILLLASIGLELVGPQILRTFIDTARSGGSPATLTSAALFFLGAMVGAQAPTLFSETLRTNILLGLPEEPATDLATALYLAVLDLDVETFERGLDTLIGTRGVKLSGGQALRAAAARMFIRAPELLVCDDLSSALDVETEQTLWERLFTDTLPKSQTDQQSGVLRERPTCLVVSHRHALLRRADSILVLKDGGIEATGQLDDLLLRRPEP